MKPTQPATVDSLFGDLCRAIVVAPNALAITVKHGSASTTIAAHPAPADIGCLIGKQGRTVKAFKLLAQAIGDRHHWPIVYAVEAPPGPNPASVDRPIHPPKDKYDAEHGLRLLKGVSAALHTHPAEVTVAVFEHHISYELVILGDEPVANVELRYTYPSSVSGKKVVETDTAARGDNAISMALNVIFQAIGQMHGVTVSVAYVRHGEPAMEEAQPQSAAGRYAKKV